MKFSQKICVLILIFSFIVSNFVQAFIVNINYVSIYDKQHEINIEEEVQEESIYSELNPIKSTNPINKSKNVNTNTNIEVYLNENFEFDIEILSIKIENLTQNKELGYTYDIEDFNKLIIKAELEEGQDYKVTLREKYAICNDDDKVSVEYSFDFTTVNTKVVEEKPKEVVKEEPKIVEEKPKEIVKEEPKVVEEKPKEIVKEEPKAPIETDSIEKITPANNAKNVLIDSKITIKFKEGFLVDKDNYKSKLKLVNKNGEPKKFTASLNDNIITIKTVNNYVTSMQYTLTLGEGIAVNSTKNYISKQVISKFIVCSNQYGIKDIDGSWAKTEILNLVKKDIINAYEDKKFLPENKIKKGEFIKILMTSIDSNLPKVEISNKYSNHWAGAYIEKAQKLNLLPEGFCKSGTFDNSITRLDLAIILARADLYLNGNLDNYLSQLSEYKNDGVSGATKLKALKSNYQKVFNDKTGLTFEGYTLILYAYGKGYVQGYNDGSFKPNSNLTRAESCVIITRLLNELK